MKGYSLTLTDYKYTHRDGGVLSNLQPGVDNFFKIIFPPIENPPPQICLRKAEWEIFTDLGKIKNLRENNEFLGNGKIKKNVKPILHTQRSPREAIISNNTVEL